MAARRQVERPGGSVLGSRRGASAIREAPFTPAADRRSVLDRAHRGDIEGALGTVPSHDTAPRISWRRRITTLLAVMGPGVLVMVANNDAGGVSVYAAAGQQYGLGALWLVIALAVVAYVIQEMVARLGAVTGAGHARLIFERFGSRWGYFALGDLLVLNLLTIITEFIGVSLALGYFGVSRYVAVPVAAASLVLVTVLGSYRRWELVMWGLVAVSLVTAPLALVAAARHSAPDVARLIAPIPAGQEGVVVLVVAIIGTTVAPWQLFFHQSNVVDKRITARWLGYERADLAVGAVLFAAGAVSILVAASLFAGGDTAGRFADAGRIAAVLADRAGWWAGALFALALLNGSVLGAATVTLANAYALGDVYGLKHSLHRGWRDARVFHGSFVLSLALSATIVLLPRAPLGMVTIGVQVLAGVLLPSATVFLLLLSNDPDVVGPRTNPRWLNLLAVTVVGVLVEMSFLLTLTTLFPALDLRAAIALLTALLAVALTGYVVVELLRPARRRARGYRPDDAFWTMPRLETLPPPRSSTARTAGLVLLRVYLMSAAALVIARMAQAFLGA